MRNLYIFAIILFSCLILVTPAQAHEYSPEEPRPPLQLCHNWSGIYVSPEEIPEGEMRFTPQAEQPRWEFQGLVTATCSLHWMRGSFDLIEVTFVDMDHTVALWVAVGIELTNGHYLSTGPGDYDQDSFMHTFQPGKRVQVYLEGPQVFDDHIDWTKCETHFCWIGQQIDATFWAGSNQLIEGSYPSKNYPSYGFLFWQVAIDEVTPPPVLQLHREIWVR